MHPATRAVAMERDRETRAVGCDGADDQRRSQPQRGREAPACIGSWELTLVGSFQSSAAGTPRPTKGGRTNSFHSPRPTPVRAPQMTAVGVRRAKAALSRSYRA